MRVAKFIVSVFFISAIAAFAQSGSAPPELKAAAINGNTGGVNEGQGRAGNSNPFGSPIVIHRGGCALGLAAIPGTAFSRIECETVTPL